MGTTLVVATVYDNILKVANVGDSRLYIIDNDIVQITRDHSLVEEMVSMGQINRSQARTHEKKNIITIAIGCYANVEAEIFSVDLKADDRILMCTDGLTNMLKDDKICEIIKQNSEQASKELVKKANEQGGYDNITAVIIL